MIGAYENGSIDIFCGTSFIILSVAISLNFMRAGDVGHIGSQHEYSSAFSKLLTVWHTYIISSIPNMNRIEIDAIFV